MSKKYNNLDANVLKKKKSTPCTQLNCQPLQGEKKKQKNIVRESVLCVWGGGDLQKLKTKYLKIYQLDVRMCMRVCVCVGTQKNKQKKNRKQLQMFYEKKIHPSI